MLCLRCFPAGSHSPTDPGLYSLQHLCFTPGAGELPGEASDRPVPSPVHSQCLQQTSPWGAPPKTGPNLSNQSFNWLPVLLAVCAQGTRPHYTHLLRARAETQTQAGLEQGHKGESEGQTLRWEAHSVSPSPEHLHLWTQRHRPSSGDKRFTCA